MKRQILRELKETGLLVGDSINQALLANDRAKYLLTLLQLAFEQARHPQSAPDNLSRERRVVELDDPLLDAVIPTARSTSTGDVRIQGLDRVLQLLSRCCAEMLDPIREAKAAEARELEARLEKLLDRGCVKSCATASEQWLRDLTSGLRTRGSGDSVHLFVMDAHRVLNRLQRELAQTRVDGVAALGIQESDRSLVRAFVRGVRRTAHLKLDHPGLDTAASRYSGRLVIQNDVGLTDSHVVVIAVSGDEIQLTYTDIHPRRLDFFRHVLEPLSPSWKEIATRSSTALVEGATYYALTGTIRATSPAGKETVLEHIGSRLVFLIDWNKARKRLRNFLSNKSAFRVLSEAAKKEIGHMAFLKLGGAELLYQAMDVAAADYLRFGEPFQAAVGAALAEECFTEILGICCEGIMNGDSLQVVRDRIVASITRAFTRKAPGSLQACRNLAGLVVEASLTLQHIMHFLRLGKGGDDFLLRSQKRIEQWENEADDIVNRVRRRESRRPSGMPLRELSGAVDDALDSIDSGTYFLIRLHVLEVESTILRVLDELASLLLRCGQEFYKAIAAVSESSTQRGQEDLLEFFESIGRLDSLTKVKDSREREYLEELFDSADGSGPVQRLREIGSRISSAVDSLARAGFLLYDSIFNPGQMGS